MDDQPYTSSLSDVVDSALQPFVALKEILFAHESSEATPPSHYACVIEALVESARAKLHGMQNPLEAKIGKVLFISATAGHPDAATGGIVGVSLEPKEAAHV